MFDEKLNQIDKESLLSTIKNEIIIQLGGDPATPFIWLYREPVETVLDMKPGSLAALHSGKRINLPFYKSGRRARYRLDDVAQYILSQRHVSTPSQDEVTA